MPLSALEQVEVDHCVPLAQMGGIITDFVRRPKPPREPPPANLQKEATIAARVATGIEEMTDFGRESFISCPDCGGVLWQGHDEKINHYRCQIGHSYNESNLLARRREQIEETLWVALRMMEERKTMLRRIAKESEEKGAVHMAASYSEQAEEVEGHIGRLKVLLFLQQDD